MLFLLMFACSRSDNEATEDTSVDLVPEPCSDTADQEWPARVDWIQFDGQSTEIFSPTDNGLPAEWQGSVPPAPLGKSDAPPNPPH